MQEWINDYFTFLRFPTISANREHSEDMIKCADWITEWLENLHFRVERWETEGAPVLFASHEEAGPEKPTLLLYHHYDVQPVDPLEEWDSPPFDPTVRNGSVYARGSQDNKGQCFYTLQALKELKKYPLNIKLCIEGEEEIGSPGLSKLLPQKRKELQADYLAIVDLGIPSIETPAITLGIRGIITFDLGVETAKYDLHSGSHGGIVLNSAEVLARILYSLKSDKGEVNIPGFYEGIEALLPEEKKKISFDFDPILYEKEIQALPLGGEQEFSPLERAWIRPTLEINGITGGYSGEGFKTVIPAKSSAKISCRLVPGQDPQKIASLVIDFIKKQEQEGCQIHITQQSGGGGGIRLSPDSPPAVAFSQAFTEVFSKPCAYILAGGSIPIAKELAKASGAEMVLLGLGLDSDAIHAPNEHFSLARMEKGKEIIKRALHLLAHS